MKKLAICCIVLCILIHTVATAQNEGNLWYFGQNAGIDFRTDPPIAFNNPNLNNVEGCACICDPAGRLLFYTDGNTVWNSQDKVMQNGADLGGHYSAVQGAQIVPYPGRDREYIMFIVNGAAESSGLINVLYVIIDMKQNNGLGSVQTRPLLLFQDITEKLTIVQHKDQRSYWLITHALKGNKYYSFLINESGVSQQPVISNGLFSFGSSRWEASGVMKPSHDGKKIVTCIRGENQPSTVELCDFNNQSGLVSNPELISFPILTYGSEFSRDNKFLYITCGRYQNTGRLYQLDMSETPKKPVLIASSDSEWYGQLQIGPDCKIYMAKYNSSSLSIISRPSNSGMGCNFISNGINLAPGSQSKLGLPSFIQTASRFSPIEILHSQAIVNQKVKFSLSFSSSMFIIWEFGDFSSGPDNYSIDKEPEHIYKTPGEYVIKAYVESQCGKDTIIKKIVVGKDAPCRYGPAGIPNTASLIRFISSDQLTVQTDSVFEACPGDKVLIVQMKGAQIEQNSPSFGAVMNRNYTGNYEFNFIKSIDSLSITFAQPLKRNYFIPGLVQIIRVPVFQDYTVTTTAGSKPWNGKTGGVFAASVNKMLTLKAPIVMDGKGFQGGISINSQFTPDAHLSDLTGSMDSSRYGLKGEGIYLAEKDFMAGRGATATGGGGGNNHNGGGGGGANGGCGGNGGFGWDKLTNGDKNLAFGIGAYAAPYSDNVVYLGGGGGAGHSNDLSGTSGAAGGGIIIIEAGEIDGNNQVISARGDKALNSPFDGAGGGGAGGTILIACRNFSSPLTLDVRGGIGGSVTDHTDGPGGGGGGGVAGFSTTIQPNALTILNDGGFSGFQKFERYGAKDGCNGIVKANIELPGGTSILSARSEDWTSPTFKTIIYPNPVHDIFTLESEISFNQISIYSASGKLFFQKSVNHGESISRISLSCTEFPSGIYSAYLTLVNNKLIGLPFIIINY
jgi:PKD repeat protein